MKLGLGFHRNRISRENFRFARQAGYTHVVVHLVERRLEGLPSRADEFCFGMTTARGVVWSFQELAAVKTLANEEGLQLEAIENIDPSFWCGILLDGPRKRQRMESLKELIRHMGRLQIPILAYNFSLAGVWGRKHEPVARGSAVVPVVAAGHPLQDEPLRRGILNNIVYDAGATEGFIPAIEHTKLWERLTEFLHALVPVAEAEGVRLAAHPDDPPVATLRRTPRLLYRPQNLAQLLDLFPCRSKRTAVLRRHSTGNV